jgi:ABC-2 type transport system ATP-binding protein
MDLVIEARGLVKRYAGRKRTVVALDGLDLSAPKGTVLGLLGPNGAGKTTAVRILSTLLEPDSGSALVAGVDVVKNPREARRRIGLSGQSAAVDEHLTGRENLVMVGRFYKLGRARSRERAEALLASFDLDEAGDRQVKTYSGGMRRRLDLAAALVAEPPVLFLDEPTTGLDPRSRQDLWGVIRDLARGATTLPLTTQYLEEADRLCDDIVVVDRGRAIAQGTPDELKSKVGGERVEVVVTDPADLDTARAVLQKVAAGEVIGDGAERRLVAPVEDGTADLARVLRGLKGVAVSDIGLRRPTLDDVFLSLTGHAAEEEQ